jgi:pyruvate-formate lyase-activating enzyme
MKSTSCELVKQGFKPGNCCVTDGENSGPACEMTLQARDDSGDKKTYRLISAAHLSRPEHYFSIYQSGCNLDCLKCHSWEFTQQVDRGGEWMSPADILEKAREYAEMVTYIEPRERATSFHALELCRGCGACLNFFVSPDNKQNILVRPSGKTGPSCPRKLEPHQIVFSPQGIGPARNIIGFTGGDICCKPAFYAECAEKIKDNHLNLHILLETNGFGLTDQNLDTLQNAGVDSFWLDIKAHDPEIHKKLTGVDVERILKLPEKMIKRGFALEILTLYIPGWVETGQIKAIARIISGVDPGIPFTILAFFPQYKLKSFNNRSPNVDEMIAAYEAAQETGLNHIKLGNPGVFLSGEKDQQTLVARLGDII